jgi:hypothetical protein
VAKNKELFSAQQRRLSRNSLLLIDLDGAPVQLDIQRHVCETIGDIPGGNLLDKVANSLCLAIHLMKYWKALVKAVSSYSFDYFCCVQVDEEWLNRGTGAAPYVVFNSKVAERVRSESSFAVLRLEEVDSLLGELVRSERLGLTARKRDGGLSFVSNFLPSAAPTNRVSV